MIGLDANQAQSKYGKSKERLNKSAREKSPVVRFEEEVFDFEERQYQTVHAGCEIPKVNTFRERTRSGRFSREKRRNSQTQGGRPSIIGWLLDKKRSTSTTIPPIKPISPLIKDDGIKADENENKEAAKNPSLSPKSRPRSKSDRFTRPSKRQVAEVYKQVTSYMGVVCKLCQRILFQAAFDWPMGPLGKIKQKYRSKSTTASPAPVKSKSDENIGGTTASRLKRRSSERQKPRKSKVAFEDQQGHSWWNYPLRLMKNATTNSSSSSSGTNTKHKRRQRHYTDPESRKIRQHQLSQCLGTFCLFFTDCNIRLIFQAAGAEASSPR